MLPFEQLHVYHDSLILIDNIYNLVQKWPKEELFGLTDQIKRASTSIALNIAEGSSRTKKEFRHFLDQARGSGYESVAILQIALKRSYVSNQNYLDLYQQLTLLLKKINALKRSLL